MALTVGVCGARLGYQSVPHDNVALAEDGVERIIDEAHCRIVGQIWTVHVGNFYAEVQQGIAKIQLLLIVSGDKELDRAPVGNGRQRLNFVVDLILDRKLRHRSWK